MAAQYGYEGNVPSDEIQPTTNEVYPSRVDLCLPGAPHRLLPIPLARLYSIEGRQLLHDFVDILDYSVQLLLETASHLSPTERERLGKMPPHFVHPQSGLLIHTSRSFASFAFQCILAEHNSYEPLMINPSWPSVFFDENGFPSFCDPEEASSPRVPPENNYAQGPPTEKSLLGEDFVPAEAAPDQPPAMDTIHQPGFDVDPYRRQQASSDPYMYQPAQQQGMYEGYQHQRGPNGRYPNGGYPYERGPYEAYPYE